MLRKEIVALESLTGAEKLIKDGFNTVVLKSQVFAGGRGKGTLSSGLKGGIQFAQTSKDAEDLSKKMLGHKLVTHQTDSEGLLVRKLLVTEGVDIDKEFYLAIVLDRSKGGPVVIASREGGVEIEEVAAKNPKAVHAEPVDILKGLTEENLNNLTKVLFPDIEKSIPSQYHNAGPREKKIIYEKLCRDFRDLVRRLYTLFEKCDSSQVEINPLAITSDKRGEFQWFGQNGHNLPDQFFALTPS